MKNLTTYDVLKVDNNFYYVCNEFNALIKHEDGTLTNVILDTIPDEDLFGKKLISKLLYINGEILFVPLNAKKIWIYNIKGRIWSEISISNSECKYKFFDAIYYENKIYFIPCKYAYLVCLDIVTRKLTYIDISRGCYKNNNEIWFRHIVVRHDNSFFCASCIGNLVFAFDLKNTTYEWIDTGIKCSGFSGMVFDGKTFWISPRNESDRIFCWCKNMGNSSIPLIGDKNEVIQWLSLDNNSIVVIKNNECIFVSVDEPLIGQKISEPLLFHKYEKGRIDSLSNKSIYQSVSVNRTYSFNIVLDENEINDFVASQINKSQNDRFKNFEVINEGYLFGINTLLSVIKKDIAHE